MRRHLSIKAPKLHLNRVKRGIVMTVPALEGLPVFEYAPNRVKQSWSVRVTRQKQVEVMVKTLLPGATVEKQMPLTLLLLRYAMPIIDKAPKR